MRVRLSSRRYLHTRLVSLFTPELTKFCGWTLEEAKQSHQSQQQNVVEDRRVLECVGETRAHVRATLFQRCGKSDPADEGKTKQSVRALPSTDFVDTQRDSAFMGDVESVGDEDPEHGEERSERRRTVEDIASRFEIYL